MALCAPCDHAEPLGAHHVSVRAPGLVVRCPHCEGVVLRLVHTRGDCSTSPA